MSLQETNLLGGLVRVANGASPGLYSEPQQHRLIARLYPGEWVVLLELPSVRAAVRVLTYRGSGWVTVVHLLTQEVFDDQSRRIAVSRVTR